MLIVNYRKINDVLSIKNSIVLIEGQMFRRITFLIH